MNIVTPVFGLMPRISDSWPCSCSLPSLCPPDTKKPRVLGNHTPTTPHGASGPESQAPGARTGPEGTICMFSVQLLDTRCRIFELRDQTAAGGLPPKPPGTRHKPSQLVNKSSPPHSLAPPRGLQTAQGAAALASGARKSIFPAHTHSLSINMGPWTLRQPPTGPKAEKRWSLGHTFKPPPLYPSH